MIPHLNEVEGQHSYFPPPLAQGPGKLSTYRLISGPTQGTNILDTQCTTNRSVGPSTSELLEPYAPTRPYENPQVQIKAWMPTYRLISGPSDADNCIPGSSTLGAPVPWRPNQTFDKKPSTYRLISGPTEPTQHYNVPHSQDRNRMSCPHPSPRLKNYLHEEDSGVEAGL